MESLRSCEAFAGITRIILYPLIAATIANAIPVLPLVASIKVSPGLISPQASALLIMLRSGLSFTEPAGLFPSSLTRIVLEPGAGRRCNRTRGVLPTVFSIVGKCIHASGIGKNRILTCLPIRGKLFGQSLEQLTAT